MTPLRIWRRRVKGYRLPPDTKSVTRPGMYGNPFRGPHAAAAFREYIAGQASIYMGLREIIGFDEIRRELRGRNLACFCSLCPVHRAGKPWNVKCKACEPCHSDLLLEIANA